MSVCIETQKGLRSFSSDIEVTKKGKALAGNQRTGKCFEEAGFQALISQLWSIHWTLCWPSDPQVTDVWMREEQMNDKCIWSETEVTLECHLSQIADKVVHPQTKGYKTQNIIYRQPSGFSWPLMSSRSDIFWCSFTILLLAYLLPTIRQLRHIFY